jgi:hypothetical protein
MLTRTYVLCEADGKPNRNAFPHAQYMQGDPGIIWRSNPKPTNIWQAIVLFWLLFLGLHPTASSLKNPCQSLPVPILRYSDRIIACLSQMAFGLIIHSTVLHMMHGRQGRNEQETRYINTPQMPCNRYLKMTA